MVSVIVPVYNAEKTISRTVESILKQSYKDIEIILVNDGSADASLTICEELKNHDQRINVISQANKGASAARNHGIRQARGEWIMFVDADDALYPEAIANLMKFSNCECDIIVGCCCKGAPSAGIHSSEIMEGNRFAEACLSRSYAIELQKKIRHLESGICIGPPWGKLFRTELLKNNDVLFPEGLAHHEDTVFCVKAYLKTDHVMLVEADVYLYNNTINSVSKRFNKTKIENMRKVVEIIASEENIEQVAPKAINDFVCNRTLDCFLGNITHKDNNQSLKEIMGQLDGYFSNPEVNRIVRSSRVYDILHKQDFSAIQRIILVMIRLNMKVIVVVICKMFQITRNNIMRRRNIQ